MSEIRLQDTRTDPELNRLGMNRSRGKGGVNLCNLMIERPPGKHIHTLSIQIHFLRQRR